MTLRNTLRTNLHNLAATLGLAGLTAATLGLAAASAGTALAADDKTLTVYTYDSFASEWGPGGKIEADFEAECGCDLQFVSVDSSVGILSRLKLEGAQSPADIALGLDTNLTAEAVETGLFAESGVNLSHFDLPIDWQDKTFVPFDYGYFAFVYDSEKLSNPPQSLAELVEGESDLKIVIQDPRSSTPGLGLMLWMQKVYGEDAGAAWAKLAPKIVTVTKGWSEAYGMFLEGEADMVLSYTTSPAYHIVAEGKEQYKAAAFTEGHYMQVEVAAKLKNAPHPELADQFLAFIGTEGFQSHIPTGNWMYPVIDLGDGLPGAFETLVSPSTALLYSPEEVRDNRKAWVDSWLQSVSQ